LSLKFPAVDCHSTTQTLHLFVTIFVCHRQPVNSKSQVFDFQGELHQTVRLCVEFLYFLGLMDKQLLGVSFYFMSFAQIY